MTVLSIWSTGHITSTSLAVLIAALQHQRATSKKKIAPSEELKATADPLDPNWLKAARAVLAPVAGAHFRQL